MPDSDLRPASGTGAGPRKRQGMCGQIRMFSFLAVFLLLTALLNFLLIPYNIARVDLHQITAHGADDLFVGASHGYSAIDPETVDRETGRRSTSACLPEEFPVDSLQIVRLACRSGHPPKRVIYELDPSYWVQEEPEQVNDSYIFRSFPCGYAKMVYFFDKIARMDWRVILAPWHFYADRLPKAAATVSVKMSSAYREYRPDPLNTYTQRFSDRGFVYQTQASNLNKGGFEGIIPFRTAAVKARQEADFARTVRLCREQGIDLAVIITPVPDETYAQFRDSFTEAHAWFSERCASYGISFRDFNDLPAGELDRSMTHYMDYEGHMDGVLAQQFSGILGKYLASLPE